MENFTVSAEEKEFTVLVPEDFDEAIDKARIAFDWAEEESGNGKIPRHRRAVYVNKLVTVIGDFPEAEIYVQSKIKKIFSIYVSKIIGRTCNANGIFTTGDIKVDGRYMCKFEVTTVALPLD